MEALSSLSRVTDTLKSIRVRPDPPVGGLSHANDAHVILWLTRHDGTQETRLSALRPPQEFLDYQRVSRPADLSTATQASPPELEPHRCGLIKVCWM
jgi:hypothetical protein